MNTIKITGIIFFLLFIIPLSNAGQLSQLKYNMDKIPLFELNNSPLIQTIEVGYLDLNNSSISRKIMDYYDSNVNADYFFNSTAILTNNKEVDILNFNINYKIKKDIKFIVPFSFVLGDWPQFLYSIDNIAGIEIKSNESINVNFGNSSLLMYGENKSILFSKLPSFEYVLEKQNGTTRLSIIGKNVSEEGSLEIKLIVNGSDKNLTSEDHFNLGRDYFLQGNIPLAKIELDISRYLFEKENNIDGEIKALQILRYAYSQPNSSPLDIQISNNITFIMIDLIMKNGKEIETPEGLYSFIGNNYFKLGDLVNSEKLLLIQYSNPPHIHADSKLPTILALGELYTITGRYYLANKFFLEAKSLCESCGQSQYIIDSLSFLETRLNVPTFNYYNETTLIYEKNGKIFYDTNLFKDFDDEIVLLSYFNNETDTNISFRFNQAKGKTSTFSDSVNDSNIISFGLIFPFKPLGNNFTPTLSHWATDNPNLTDVLVFGPSSSEYQTMKFINIEKTVIIELKNLDRYIGINSVNKESKISYVENRTVIYWNSSNFSTLPPFIGIPNRTKNELSIISGNLIILTKPESRKYRSEENGNLKKLIEFDYPTQIQVIRKDTRYPLKPLVPIPIALDTSTRDLIEYVAINGKQLDGPWDFNPNMGFEEGRYYFLRSSENSSLIQFIKNTSESINVTVAYTRDISSYVHKVNEYTWEYNIRYFYNIGDIPDYFQKYTFNLPENYRFAKTPKDSYVQAIDDGRESLVISFDDSSRFRELNFTIEKIEKQWWDKISA